MNANKALTVAIALMAVGGCVRSEATRTYMNTMLIDTGAAPACGPQGAARAAAQTAAVETLRAGYERYIITDALSTSDVRVTQLPGTIQTYGSVTNFGSMSSFGATSTYIPGPEIVSGRHSRSLAVVMFNPGDRGYSQALDAKTTLGPEWERKVRDGVNTCFR